MKRTKGFTLVELLVVVAIIALLISILLPALKGLREMTRRVICQSNQKNIYNGAQAYAQAYNGYYPPQVMGYWQIVWGQTVLTSQTWFGMSPPSKNVLAYYGNGAGVYACQAAIFRQTRFISDAKLWYCPSQTAKDYQWDNQYEPWGSRPSTRKEVYSWTPQGGLIGPIAIYDARNVSYYWMPQYENNTSDGLKFRKAGTMRPGKVLVQDVMSSITLVAHPNSAGVPGWNLVLASGQAYWSFNLPSANLWIETPWGRTFSGLGLGKTYYAQFAKGETSANSVGASWVNYNIYRDYIQVLTDGRDILSDPKYDWK